MIRTARLPKTHMVRSGAGGLSPLRLGGKSSLIYLISFCSHSSLPVHANFEALVLA